MTDKFTLNYLKEAKTMNIKHGINLKKLIKDGFEILGFAGKGILLGKGLFRIIFDLDKDEILSTYVLNK